MEKQLFPGSQVPGRKGTVLRKGGKRKRPGKGESPSGLDAAARPAGRRNPPPPPEGRRSSTKAPGEWWETKVRRDLWVLHLPPKIGIPRKPPAGSPASRTSCRRARVRHAGSVEGRRRAGCSAALLCIPVGSADWQDRAHFERVRERARGWASLQRARVGKTSRMHQVQSREPTVRGRERTASSGSTGCSHREPRRTRSARVSPKLPSLKGGIKSNQEEEEKQKIPPRFL